jgi:glucosamine kinase
MSKTVLIADCGGSKGDWRLLLPDGRIEQYETEGINPYYQNRIEIIQRISQGLQGVSADEIQYYGAGCGRQERCDLIRESLLELWPQADMEVHSDVLGSARASCGKEPGIACILGTGSNACFFDGQAIMGQAPSLGFWLGDEGSGGHLGKLLLSRYLNGSMPEDLAKAFSKRYPGDLSYWLDLIYQKEKSPNASIAALAKFAFDHKNQAYISSLIMESFLSFLDIYVAPLMKNHGPLPVHFTGSIAFYYNRFVQAALEQRGWAMGRVLEKPIAGLSLYHSFKP